MEKRPTNKEIRDILTSGYCYYKEKFPEREKIEIFDWKLDFENNYDWALWEKEMDIYEW